MAKFNAGESVDTLDYDFTDFVDGAKGTIPEPTNAQIESLRQTLAGMFPTTTDDKGGTVLDLAALRTRMDEGENLEQELLDALAAFCTGNPSAEQIGALPYRAQRAFVGWLMGMFFSPEG